MRDLIPDESVDLIYLDPPFNSKRIYNAFHGGAQWVAFDDTWRWHEAIEDFQQVAGSVQMAPTMEGLRSILGEGSSLAYLSYMANRLRECRRVLKPTGSIYLHCDPTMSRHLKTVMDALFGRKNFLDEIIWNKQNGVKSKKRWGNENENILCYAKKYGKHTFNIKDSICRKPYSDLSLQMHFTNKDADGRLFRKRIVNGKSYIYYADEGRFIGNLWDDVPSMQANTPLHGESTGYPTQKPLALLERIIRASSKPGDVVLDPFCGCGTTIHAAHELHRCWVGVDVCVKACQIIQQRLERRLDISPANVEFIGLPKTAEDARSLADLDKFRFERWAASLVDGMEANKKQRGDGGIDGRGRIAIRRGEFIDIVSQVKGGRTGPGDVQAFNGARQEAKAELGVFTCFEGRVTSRMKDAAANAGRFMDVPVIQIYTVEDFFEQRVPQFPLPMVA